LQCHTYINYITIHNKETGVSHTQKHYNFGPKWGPRSEPWWSTYRYMLEAFVAKVKGEEPPHWVSLEESIQVMDIVDMVYEAAGMPKRGL
jgi:predicted dehydrogenase